MPTLQIGVCNDDPYKINKIFQSSYSPTVNVKGGTTISNPTFILDYNSGYTTCNYCYYADFNRYYYIADIFMSPGGKAEIVCTSDPLMSFSNEINSLTCYLDRVGEATKRAGFITDSNYPITNELFVHNYGFSVDPFEIDPVDSQGNQSANYVLTVLGGGATQQGGLV